jgi:hypothetical protein
MRAVVAVLLLLPMTASAQDYLYKCSTSTGNVHYQNDPCPPGTQIERLDLRGPDTTKLDAAIRLVKVGMSHAQVGSLGQVGNRALIGRSNVRLRVDR